MTSFEDIAVTTIDGESKRVADFPGTARLVVNVASRCGFTPQYAGLEALWREKRGRGLVVMGFPCDQFMGQEPGGEADIKAFCGLTYDVTFPMFAKIEVNGVGAHPLFKALKSAAPGLLGSEAVKWNFTKFLIDARGDVRRFAPTIKPEDMAADVERAL